MTLIELKNIVDKAVRSNPHKEGSVVGVVIAEKRIGGASIVEIEYAGLGFDWDNGKFMLHPSQPLKKTA